RKLNWPEEVDTSNPNTFERFCEDIIKAFPAEHYAFITYANGGTGWQRYNFDDSNGPGLTTPELAESLRRINLNVNHKIDVLFTSCCMSTIELAYEISPYVDYMVTTQEHITGYRLVQRFYLAVKDLHNNSNMSPEQFAKKAAERHIPQICPYMESYGKKPSPLTKILDMLPFPGLHTVIIKTSVTVLNLTRIDRLFKSVQNLSSYLLLSVPDKETKETIKTARENVKEFGKASLKNRIINFLYSIFPLKLLSYDRSHPVNKIIMTFWWLTEIFYTKFPLEIFSYDCSIDLYNFTELISKNSKNSYLKNLCYDVRTEINETVTVIKKVQNDSSHGISIYFPSCKVLYNKFVVFGKTPSPYENLKFSEETSWDDFLRDYLNINVRCAKV
ncbi:MAG: hypothetical protein KAW47_10320, partial [Thermoplasmatales archaeon]|nr:hypothetical protein [Thermoplasmatales archaeon]